MTCAFCAGPFARQNPCPFCGHRHETDAERIARLVRIEALLRQVFAVTKIGTADQFGRFTGEHPVPRPLLNQLYNLTEDPDRKDTP